MLIKTTMRRHCIPLKVVKTWWQQNSGKDREKPDYSHIAGDNAKRYNSLEN